MAGKNSYQMYTQVNFKLTGVDESVRAATARIKQLAVDLQTQKQKISDFKTTNGSRSTWNDRQKAEFAQMEADLKLMNKELQEQKKFAKEGTREFNVLKAAIEGAENMTARMATQLRRDIPKVIQSINSLGAGAQEKIRGLAEVLGVADAKFKQFMSGITNVGAKFQPGRETARESKAWIDLWHNMRNELGLTDKQMAQFGHHAAQSMTNLARINGTVTMTVKEQTQALKDEIKAEEELRKIPNKQYSSKGEAEAMRAVSIRRQAELENQLGNVYVDQLKNPSKLSNDQLREATEGAQQYVDRAKRTFTELREEYQAYLQYKEAHPALITQKEVSDSEAAIEAYNRRLQSASYAALKDRERLLEEKIPRMSSSSAQRAVLEAELATLKERFAREEEAYNQHVERLSKYTMQKAQMEKDTFTVNGKEYKGFTAERFGQLDDWAKENGKTNSRGELIMSDDKLIEKNKELTDSEAKLEKAIREGNNALQNRATIGADGKASYTMEGAVKQLGGSIDATTGVVDKSFKNIKNLEDDALKDMKTFFTNVKNTTSDPTIKDNAVAVLDAIAKENKRRIATMSSDVESLAKAYNHWKSILQFEGSNTQDRNQAKREMGKAVSELDKMLSNPKAYSTSEIEKAVKISNDYLDTLNLSEKVQNRINVAIERGNAELKKRAETEAQSGSLARMGMNHTQITKFMEGALVPVGNEFKKLKEMTAPAIQEQIDLWKKAEEAAQGDANKIKQIQAVLSALRTEQLNKVENVLGKPMDGVATDKIQTAITNAKQLRDLYYDSTKPLEKQGAEWQRINQLIVDGEKHLHNRSEATIAAQGEALRARTRDPKNQMWNKDGILGMTKEEQQQYTQYMEELARKAYAKGDNTMFDQITREMNEFRHTFNELKGSTDFRALMADFTKSGQTDGYYSNISKQLLTLRDSGKLTKEQIAELNTELSKRNASVYQNYKANGFDGNIEEMRVLIDRLKQYRDGLSVTTQTERDFRDAVTKDIFALEEQYDGLTKKERQHAASKSDYEKAVDAYWRSQADHSRMVGEAVSATTSMSVQQMTALRDQMEKTITKGRSLGESTSALEADYIKLTAAIEAANVKLRDSVINSKTGKVDRVALSKMEDSDRKALGDYLERKASEQFAAGKMYDWRVTIDQLREMKRVGDEMNASKTFENLRKDISMPGQSANFYGNIIKELEQLRDAGNLTATQMRQLNHEMDVARQKQQAAVKSEGMDIINGTAKHPTRFTFDTSNASAPVLKGFDMKGMSLNDMEIMMNKLKEFRKTLSPDNAYEMTVLKETDLAINHLKETLDSTAPKAKAVKDAMTQGQAWDILINPLVHSTEEVNKAMKVMEDTAKQAKGGIVNNIGGANKSFEELTEHIVGAKQQLDKWSHDSSLENMRKQFDLFKADSNSLSDDALKKQVEYWSVMGDEIRNNDKLLKEYRNNLEQTRNELRSRAAQDISNSMWGSLSLSPYKAGDITKNIKNLDSLNIGELKQMQEHLRTLLNTEGTGSADSIMLMNKDLEILDRQLHKVDKDYMSVANAQTMVKAISDKSVLGGTGIEYTVQNLERAKAALEAYGKSIDQTTAQGVADFEANADAIKQIEVELNKLHKMSKAATGTGASSAVKNLSRADFNAIRQAAESGTNALTRLFNNSKLSVDDYRAALKMLRDDINSSKGLTVDALNQMGVAAANLDKKIKDMTETEKHHVGTLENAADRLKNYVMIYMGFQQVLDTIRTELTKNFELSDEIADIQKVTGMASKYVGELSNQIAELNSRTSHSELMKLAYQGGKMGIGSDATNVEYQQQQLASFVNTANQLNMALGEDFGGVQAIASLAKLTQVMKVQETENVQMNEALEKTGSAILMLGNNSIASYNKISQFATRMGGIAMAAHISMPELLALGSTLDTFGAQSEMAATAMTKFVSQMVKQPTKVAIALGMVGDEIKNFQDMVWNGHTMDAMQLVFDSLKKNGADLNTIASNLKDLVGGGNNTRALQVLTEMAHGADTLRQHLQMSKEAFEENTLVSEEYYIKNTTAQAYMERMTNTLREQVVNSGIAEMFTKMAKAANDVVTSVGNVRAGLVTLALYAYTLAKTWTFVMTTVAGKTLGLLNAIKMGIIAIGSGSEYTFGHQIKKQFSDTFKGIGKSFKVFWLEWKLGWQTARGHAKTAINSTRYQINILKGSINTLVPSFTGAFKALGGVITGVGAAIGKLALSMGWIFLLGQAFTYVYKIADAIDERINGARRRAEEEEKSRMSSISNLAQEELSEIDKEMRDLTKKMGVSNRVLGMEIEEVEQAQEKVNKSRAKSVELTQEQKDAIKALRDAEAATHATALAAIDAEKAKLDAKGAVIEKTAEQIEAETNLANLQKEAIELEQQRAALMTKDSELAVRQAEAEATSLSESKIDAVRAERSNSMQALKDILGAIDKNGKAIKDAEGWLDVLNTAAAGDIHKNIREMEEAEKKAAAIRKRELNDRIALIKAGVDYNEVEAEFAEKAGLLGDAYMELEHASEDYRNEKAKGLEIDQKIEEQTRRLGEAEAEVARKRADLAKAQNTAKDMIAARADGSTSLQRERQSMWQSELDNANRHLAELNSVQGQIDKIAGGTISNWAQKLYWSFAKSLSEWQIGVWDKAADARKKATESNIRSSEAEMIALKDAQDSAVKYAKAQLAISESAAKVHRQNIEGLKAEKAAQDEVTAAALQNMKAQAENYNSIVPNAWNVETITDRWDRNAIHGDLTTLKSNIVSAHVALANLKKEFTDAGAGYEEFVTLSEGKSQAEIEQLKQTLILRGKCVKAGVDMVKLEAEQAKATKELTSAFKAFNNASEALNTVNISLDGHKAALDATTKAFEDYKKTATEVSDAVTESYKNQIGTLEVRIKKDEEAAEVAKSSYAVHANALENLNKVYETGKTTYSDYTSLQNACSTASENLAKKALEEAEAQKKNGEAADESNSAVSDLTKAEDKDTKAKTNQKKATDAVTQAEKDRRDAIADINSSYSQYIGYILKETSANYELANSLALVTAQRREDALAQEKANIESEADKKYNQKTSEQLGYIQKVFQDTQKMSSADSGTNTSAFMKWLNDKIKTDKDFQDWANGTHSTGSLGKVSKAVRTFLSENLVYTDGNKKRQKLKLSNLEIYKIWDKANKYITPLMENEYNRYQYIEAADAMLGARQSESHETSFNETMNSLNQLRKGTKNADGSQNEDGIEQLKKKLEDLLKTPGAKNSDIAQARMAVVTAMQNYIGQANAHRTYFSDRPGTWKVIAQRMEDYESYIGKQRRETDWGKWTDIENKQAIEVKDSWISLKELWNGKNKMGGVNPLDMKTVTKFGEQVGQTFSSYDEALAWVEQTKKDLQEQAKRLKMTELAEWDNDKKGSGDKDKWKTEAKDQYNAYLKELDDYYVRKQTDIEQKRAEGIINQEQYQQQTEVLENAHLLNREKLRNGFLQKTDKFNKELGVLSEDMVREIFGKGDEKFKYKDWLGTKDLKKSFLHTAAMLVKMGDGMTDEIKLNLDKDGIAIATVVRKHRDEIEKILLENNPFGKMVAETRKQLFELRLLLSDDETVKFDENKQAAVMAKRTTFMLEEQKKAYKLNAQQLMEDMKAAGLGDWAEWMAPKPEETEALIQILRNMYDQVLDAVKKEHTRIKKDTDLIWENPLAGFDKSTKQLFDDQISHIERMQSAIEKYNSTMEAGFISERKADKLNVMALQAKLKKEQTYLEILKAQKEMRLTSLKVSINEMKNRIKTETDEKKRAEMEQGLMISEIELANLKRNIIDGEDKVLQAQDALADKMNDIQMKTVKYFKDWTSFWSQQTAAIFDAYGSNRSEKYNELAMAEYKRSQRAEYNKQGEMVDYYPEEQYIVLTYENSGKGHYEDGKFVSDVNVTRQVMTEEEKIQYEMQLERENRVKEAWRKMMEEISNKMGDMINDVITRMFDNMATNANTDATERNTQAINRAIEALNNRSNGTSNGGNKADTSSAGDAGSGISVSGSNSESGVEKFGYEEPIVKPKYDSATGKPIAEGMGPVENAPVQQTPVNTSPFMQGRSAIDPNNLWESSLPATPVPDYQAQIDAHNEFIHEMIIGNDQLTKSDKEHNDATLKGTQSMFHGMTQAANLYSAAYQAFGNENLSAEQQWELFALQAAGQAAMAGLQSMISFMTAKVAANQTIGFSQAFAEAPWGAIGLMAVVSAALGAAMAKATSSITKSKTEIASVTGASSNAGRLASGMLTYAEGRYDAIDGGSTTPTYVGGKRYNVHGADGNDYNAQYMGEDWKTGILKDAHFGIMSEKKPELIVDGDTTQVLQSKYPGILSMVQDIANGRDPMLDIDYQKVMKSINTRDITRAMGSVNMAKGMPTFASGNLEDFVSASLGGGINANITANSTVTAESSANAAVMAQLLTLLQSLNDNGVRTDFHFGGSDGFDANNKKNQDWRKRHNYRS